MNRARKGLYLRSPFSSEAGVHPKQLANTLPRAEVLKIWNTAVKQMQVGAQGIGVLGLRS